MPPSAAPVQLTEKLLINAGGWDAIRHARALRETGRVSGAHWSPPLLQGFVREGDKELRSGLKILSASNVENICTCRVSREYGTICAHSLAVGLAVVAGQPSPGTAAPRLGTFARCLLREKRPVTLLPAASSLRCPTTPTPAPTLACTLSLRPTFPPLGTRDRSSSAWNSPSAPGAACSGPPV